MPNFTASLSREGQELTFHFSEIIRLYASRFHVQVTDSNGSVLSFDMSKEEEGWQVCPPAPQWVMDRQHELSSLIQQAKRGKPASDAGRLSIF